MTKQCILCKIEESPLCNCSFHKFPAKEILREKWLIALNLTKSQNTRNKYVCSNHFDEQSYHSHDEYRSRKRLRSGVVPIHCLETPTENVAQKTLNEPMEVTKEISEILIQS
ncbi:hypothetical protein ALC62_01779 [Cyphomyrmex costatus]|uniref:THAP-type domain-containing protein n=1 Tax=Cyphomyrmex costatus TaxID=456900 RepID=A0A151IPJ3_9HYME|nr:hypothetical protein ALC62_01779 [Cyphomyrmex costatus]